VRRRLLLLIGITCLLADLTYESFRSILYMVMRLAGGGLTQLCTLWGLGDLATVAGRIVGSIVSVAGRMAILYALGYLLTTMLPIPLYFPRISILYIAYLTERTGKGMRGPSRDIIIKTISERAGKAFGIVEALDQAGAVAGPVILLLILSFYRDVKTFVDIAAIFLTFSSMILATVTIYVASKVRTLERGFMGRRLLRPGRRALLYTSGTFLISSCLFPIVGIQYISFVHGNVSEGLIMFVIATVVSSVTSLAMGEAASRKVSVLLTLFLPLTSMMGVCSWSNVYIVGLLYGVSMAIVEVLFRGLASLLGDVSVYAILSLAICCGSFLSAIMFPLLYRSVMYTICYLAVLYVAGMSLILSSLR